MNAGPIAWLKGLGRKRAEALAVVEAEARALIAEKGRIGALFALDAMRNAARTGADRRRASDLQAAINRLAPRPSRADTATRMLYRRR